MIAKLRDAKEQLSELVKRAAGGEDIIITVRGEPMARLSSVSPSSSNQQSRSSFAKELAHLANSVRTKKSAISSASSWDELRTDRF